MDASLRSGTPLSILYYGRPDGPWTGFVGRAWLVGAGLFANIAGLRRLLLQGHIGAAVFLPTPLAMISTDFESTEFGGESSPRNAHECAVLGHGNSTRREQPRSR